MSLSNSLLGVTDLNRQSEMTEFEDWIICPSCGERDEEFADYPLFDNDGDERWHYCSVCDYDFKVTVSIEWKYRSAKVASG